MNSAALHRLVNAVLYEGYILYPYRASSVKNQRERFTFGRVYPEGYSIAQHGAEPWIMQTECLLVAAPDSKLHISVRFLHRCGVKSGPLPNLSPNCRPPVNRRFKSFRN